MEHFIVSARKYRPQTFDTVVDQSNIVTTLKNAIERKQLAHAYLFCGPRGVGKTTCARIFAKTINCEHPTENMEACGECESCRSFAEGRSYSIHEMDAASNNSVDAIRDLIDKVKVPPQTGKYSVYIIDEVHMLSTQAFNAFLKTLEEPPSYALFIMATTEKHKVLPTILSRCQTFDFNRISIRAMVEHLGNVAAKEGVTIGQETLHVIAQRADGAMRDALTLLDQCIAICGKDITYSQAISNLNILDFEYYFKLTEMALSGDYSQMLMLFDEILSQGFNALHFIGGLSNHFRDLLVSSHKASLPLLKFADEVNAKYREQAAKCPEHFLLQALSICTQTQGAYKSSNNQRLLVEMALIKLSQILVPVVPQQITTPQAVIVNPQNIVSPTAKTAGTATSAGTSTATGTSAKIAAGTSAATGTSADTGTSAKTTAAATTTAAGTSAKTIDSKENGSPIIADSKPTTTIPKPAGNAASPLKGMSIKEMIKQAKESSTNKSKGDEIIQVTENRDFGQEDLNQVWLKYAKTKESQQRLAAALRNTQPTLKAGFKVEFPLSNQLQLDWMTKNCLSEATSFLKSELKNNSLSLEFVLIKQSEQKHMYYMPEEKAKHILEIHPAVRELRNKLDLELS